MQAIRPPKWIRIMTHETHRHPSRSMGSDHDDHFDPDLRLRRDTNLSNLKIQSSKSVSYFVLLESRTVGKPPSRAHEENKLVTNSPKLSRCSGTVLFHPNPNHNLESPAISQKVRRKGDEVSLNGKLLSFFSHHPPNFKKFNLNIFSVKLLSLQVILGITQLRSTYSARYREL